MKKIVVFKVLNEVFDCSIFKGLNDHSFKQHSDEFCYMP